MTLHDDMQLHKQMQARRRQAEETLRETNSRLHEIIEFLPDATFVINKGGRVIAWNRAMEEMTGISKAEMIGKGDYEYALPFYGYRRPMLIDMVFLPEKGYAELKDRYDVSYWSGDTLIGEVYVPGTYGGRGAYLLATASRLRDASGSIIGAIESLRDITSRRLMEEALAAEKELFAVTLRSISDGVITTDTEGKVALINDAAIDITGWSREEAAGKPLAEVLSIIDEQTGGTAGNPLERAFEIADKGTPLRPTKLLARAGTRKLISESGAPIKKGSGQVVGYVIVFRDITEHKRMESQMALSQKLESIGQLAAGIAHEINTPMQYIGDNTMFLQNTFIDVLTLWNSHRRVIEALENNTVEPELIAEVRKKEEELDIEYLMFEIPEAIEQSLEGIERVSSIVKAMKVFTHPGSKEKNSPACTML